MRVYRVIGGLINGEPDMYAATSEGEALVQPDGWYYIYDGMDDGAGPFPCEQDARWRGTLSHLTPVVTVFDHRDRSMWQVLRVDEGGLVLRRGLRVYQEPSGPWKRPEDVLAMLGQTNWAENLTDWEPPL